MFCHISLDVCHHHFFPVAWLVLSNTLWLPSLLVSCKNCILQSHCYVLAVPVVADHVIPVSITLYDCHGSYCYYGSRAVSLYCPVMTKCYFHYFQDRDSGGHVSLMFGASSTGYCHLWKCCLLVFMLPGTRMFVKMVQILLGYLCQLRLRILTVSFID